MAEKVVPQAFASVGAFDKSGNVGDGKPVFFCRTNDTDGGMKSGEGVVGDLGFGGGKGGEEARLAGVGKSHQSDLGNRFQDEDEFPGFPGLALLRVAGGLPDRTGEAGVAAAAAAATAERESLARLSQVGQRLSLLTGEKRINYGSGWHLEDARFAVFSSAVVAAALAAVAGAGVGTEAKIDQIIDLGIHLENDVATSTAVASVGSSLGDEFFAVKADDAIAAVPGLGVEADAVNEHGRSPTNEVAGK
jgi:hypothetical protein